MTDDHDYYDDCGCTYCYILKMLHDKGNADWTGLLKQYPAVSGPCAR